MFLPYKIMKRYIIVVFIVVVFAILYSCKKDTTLPADFKATPYTLKIPARFPAPIIAIDNPMTVEGIKLGRMFYYDPILSTNGKSCVTCHFRENSYSSAPLFLASNGAKISVIPHINLAWNPDFLWDGSEPTLDREPLADFGPEFFNTNMSELIQKLKNHPKYPILFKQAFNIDDIATLSEKDLQLKIVYAITQFLRTMISADSKYDKMLKRQVNFTPEEMDGMQTFMTERGDCFHCHGDPLMTSNTFNNNGLDSVLTGSNLGRYLVTLNDFDKGKFSSPTLRNIELTAPFMHDGRFTTLEEVVEFYNSGVHWNSPNIDPIMTKPAKKYGLGLSTTQKANLVKFLKTLTDTAYINNKDFMSPF